MTLPTGTRLGPYEIVAPLGAGAMGEVYRARDPRLGRDVAVKVLPPAFAADAGRMHRFTQEARAAGSLQHPNIATVFDVGTEGTTAYVVQELVAGGTLRDRLARGALSMRETLRISAGVASGLAAAHEKGIVHRDLKPENVALGAEDRPQILDFGLARVEVRSQDATVAVQDSAAGLVIGTVGYMAPEQVRGEPTDARTDLFAVGAMLHEMLSGVRPFSKGSAVETMHAILADEPPPLPATVPAAVARVVARCLEKDPSRRFQSARDLAFALELFAGEGVRAEAPQLAAGGAVATPRGAPWLPIGLVLVAIAAGFAAGRLTAPRSAEATLRVAALSQGTRDNDSAVSPDGRMVAFTAVRAGGRGIWLMDMVTRSEVRLTSGVDYLPRFTADAGSVLFTRDAGGRRSLWRVPVLGGSPRLVMEDANDADASPDGKQIAFISSSSDSANNRVSLRIASSDGGGARELWSAASVVLQAPRWSPDGRRVAIVRAGSQNAPNSIIVVDVAGGAARVHAAPNNAVLSTAVWDGTGDGILVAEGEGILAAQRGASGRLYRLDVGSGDYRPLAWLADFANTIDLLPDGRLVMAGLGARQNLMEVEVGARNLNNARWLTRSVSIDRQPVYSPDGRSIMFSSNRGGTLDLWELSLETGEMHRLTEDPADDWDPAYSADGHSIYWSSNRTGAFEIWTARRDGTAHRQVSRDSLDAENPGVTPDGRWVVYTSSNPAKAGLWRVPTAGGEGELLQPGGMLIPDLSPDGRHVSVNHGVGTLGSALAVYDLEGRRLLPVSVPNWTQFGGVQLGRSRWTPDGRAVVFLGADSEGHTLLLRRPLEAWRGGSGGIDTLLADARDVVESFGFSRDGKRAVISVIDWLSSLAISEPVAGVTPPKRRVAR